MHIVGVHECYVVHKLIHLGTILVIVIFLIIFFEELNHSHLIVRWLDVTANCLEARVQGFQIIALKVQYAVIIVTNAI